MDSCAVSPLDVGSVPLNVAQRVSVVLDFSRMDPKIATRPSLWLRVTVFPGMYPTFDATAPSMGLFGTASGEPLAVEWLGLITFAGEGGGLPTYDPAHFAPPNATSEDSSSDAYVHPNCPPGGVCVYVATPVETNLLAARSR